MSRSASAVAAVIKAYDVRGLVGTQLDDAFVRDVGAAFARLVRASSDRVVIGHDMRESSPGLSEAFAEGVLAQGLDVVRIGLASTDQLYFASGLLVCPGAMFTASHNPAAYNGIKLCRAGAKPVGEDTGLAVIRDEVIAGVPGYDGPAGEIHDRDVLTEYGKFLRSLVNLTDLRPLRVAVDAGNGMAGHTAPAVFGPIDALTVLPLYFELDGTFPNHEANPLDPANLVDLQQAFDAEAAHRQDARHQVVGAQDEGTVDAADDVPHHQLGGDLGMQDRGQDRVPRPAGSAGDDARADAQSGDQGVQRVGTHVGFALTVELQVGLSAVGPVPQQHAVAALDQFVGERTQALDVLAVAPARCECDELPGLTEDLVHDVAAVDLEDLLAVAELRAGHAITSTSSPTTRTG